MDISKGTIARTVILILALVNQVLTMCGLNPLPFSEDMIYELITLLCTIGAAAWAWWKNNSFTKNAIEADKYKKELDEKLENSSDIW